MKYFCCGNPQHIASRSQPHSKIRGSRGEEWDRVFLAFRQLCISMGPIRKCESNYVASNNTLYSLKVVVRQIKTEKSKGRQLGSAAFSFRLAKSTRLVRTGRQRKQLSCGEHPFNATNSKSVSKESALESEQRTKKSIPTNIVRFSLWRM